MSLDKSALDSYREFMGEDAPAFIAEIISSFMDSAPKLVATLEHALPNSDQEAFIRAAHTLKSTSATIGATLLAALAAEMEIFGKTDEWKNLSGKLDEVKEELQRVIETLRSQEG